MRTGIKDFALGVVIAMSVFVLAGMAIYFFASGMSPLMDSTSAPAPTATPIASTATLDATLAPAASPTIIATITFTPIPTFTPVRSPAATAPPSQTNTPDPIHQALDAGAVVFAGPLSDDEQVALYRSSLNYVRSTAEDSRLLAKEINGVGYGDPTNICGPLAIAILRDANLVTHDILPHDFWLLNPNASVDAQILGRVFPWELYSHVVTATPLNKMDWQASPLLPGDFLFIWHGSGGNFDHMLVVSRVDSGGRAYAVTNYGTDAGYVISEALLYDPADPTVGLFHQWTQVRNAILGSTGFGGFELWRRRAP